MGYSFQKDEAVWKSRHALYGLKDRGNILGAPTAHLTPFLGALIHQITWFT